MVELSDKQKATVLTYLYEYKQMLMNRENLVRAEAVKKHINMLRAEWLVKT